MPEEVAYPLKRSATKPRLITYQIAEKVGIAPEEARRILEQAIRAISDEDLRNFRGGQITVVV